MPVRSHRATVLIGAPATLVWTIVSEVEKWPSWTPTMTAVTGRTVHFLELNAEFDVRQPGLRPSTMKVTQLEHGRSFAWSSTSLGMVTTADHVLRSVDDAFTEVELVFTLSGPLAGVAWAMFGRKIRSFVDTEAASLTVACE